MIQVHRGNINLPNQINATTLCQQHRTRQFTPLRFHKHTNGKRKQKLIKHYQHYLQSRKQRRKQKEKEKKERKKRKEKEKERRKKRKEREKRKKEKKRNNELYNECRKEIRKQKDNQIQLLNAMFGFDDNHSSDNDVAYVIDQRKDNPLSFQNSINQPLTCNYCDQCKNCDKCRECEFCNINNNENVINDFYLNYINKSDIINDNINKLCNTNDIDDYINNNNNCYIDKIDNKFNNINDNDKNIDNNNDIDDDYIFICNNCKLNTCIDDKLCKICKIKDIYKKLTNLNDKDNINSMNIIDYLLLSNFHCNHLHHHKKDKLHTINTIDHINSTSISKSKYTGDQWPEDTVLTQQFNRHWQIRAWTRNNILQTRTHEIQLFADTGATISACNEKYATKHYHKFIKKRKKPLAVRVASGDIMNLKYYISLPIHNKQGKRVFEHNFYLIPHLKHNFLASFYFLQKVQFKFARDAPLLCKNYKLEKTIYEHTEDRDETFGNCNNWDKPRLKSRINQKDYSNDPNFQPYYHDKNKIIKTHMLNLHK